MSHTQRAFRLEATDSFGDRLASWVCWSTAILISSIFLWIVSDLVRHGMGQIDLSFLINEPTNAGRAGGIGPAIVSTMAILLIALVTSIPLATATAIYLAEYSRRKSLIGTLVGRSLDVLAAVPSIVFGLFGHALFCQMMGLGYSILAGGLTLACMILPILIRSMETGLRAVPNHYRIAAMALGMSRIRTIFSILVPSAIPGMVVGIVLGIGRVLAETAALLFTSGYVDRMPTSFLDSGRSMSIHIYELAMNVSGGELNAYATALVLVALLLVINWGAVWLGDRWLDRS